MENKQNCQENPSGDLHQYQEQTLTQINTSWARLIPWSCLCHQTIYRCIVTTCTGDSVIRCNIVIRYTFHNRLPHFYCSKTVNNTPLTHGIPQSQFLYMQMQKWSFASCWRIYHLSLHLRLDIHVYNIQFWILGLFRWMFCKLMVQVRFYTRVLSLIWLKKATAS